MRTYRFRIGVLIFILNVQQSTIGFSYPRIFIAWPDNSYSNLDLTLGTIFKMSEKDWFSWFDDELIELDDIQQVNEICGLYGIKADALIDWAFDALTAKSFN